MSQEPSIEQVKPAEQWIEPDLLTRMRVCGAGDVLDQAIAVMPRLLLELSLAIMFSGAGAYKSGGDKRIERALSSVGAADTFRLAVTSVAVASCSFQAVESGFEIPDSDAKDVSEAHDDVTKYGMMSAQAFRTRDLFMKPSESFAARASRSVWLAMNELTKQLEVASEQKRQR